MLGDGQYETGSLDAYRSKYDRTACGRLKSITKSPATTSTSRQGQLATSATSATHRRTTPTTPGADGARTH
jgi:hypothetical protein